MNRNDYIILGERLLNYVKETGCNTQRNRNSECRRLFLKTEDILELTKNENILKNQKFLFGRYIYGWYEWSLDLVHKIKSKGDILSVKLKQNDKEVLTGAFSKSNKGAMNYHFTSDNTLLQTGNTANTGYLNDYRRTIILPERFYDYLWKFDDKTLIFMSEMFGIGGKKHNLEQVSKEYDICYDTIDDRKKYYLKLLNSMYNSDNYRKFNKTEPSGYTVIDYIKALRESKNNCAYRYLDNLANGKLTADVIIDDEFLKDIKQARTYKKIIDEWRKNIKELG